MNEKHWLTHWDWVIHICIGNLTIIGSDIGLVPTRGHAIIWIDAGILLIEPLGTNFNRIWIKIKCTGHKNGNHSPFKHCPWAQWPKFISRHSLQHTLEHFFSHSYLWFSLWFHQSDTIIQNSSYILQDIKALQLFIAESLPYMWAIHWATLSLKSTHVCSC